MERLTHDTFKRGQKLEFLGGKIDRPARDDHEVRVGYEALGLREKFQAIHSWHLIVGYDHAGIKRGKVLECFLWRSEGVNLAGEVRPEKLPEGFENQRLVIDKEKRATC